MVDQYVSVYRGVLAARRRSRPDRARRSSVNVTDDRLETHTRSDQPDFRVGVNYGRARTAMGWWNEFDAGEVRSDFARIVGAGVDSTRIFLTWEAFQPSARSVDP